MEFEPQDRKVVELLTKLKGANEGYPSDLLAARRQAFLNKMNSMAGAGLGVGTGMAFSGTLKSGSGLGAAPITAGTLLEVALLVAIVVEASALAYFNRDKIAEVFRSLSATARVQESASPPVITSPFPEIEISGVPISAVPTETVTVTGTPASTPIPGVTEDPAINNNEEATLTGLTPNPNGNNGNHYGQTPKPERTKDNNKPPKDNPGNGNNAKPPKGNKDKSK